MNTTIKNLGPLAEDLLRDLDEWLSEEPDPALVVLQLREVQRAERATRAAVARLSGYYVDSHGLEDSGLPEGLADADEDLE